MKNYLFLFIAPLLAFSSCSKKESIFLFDANENLFTAYAFMNAAGFDQDWSEMHKIRIEIRSHLDTTLNNNLKEKMKKFYQQHNAGFSSYGKYALLLSKAPEFKIESLLLKQETVLAELEGLNDLIRAFYNQAKIKELWKKYKPIIQAINDEYQPFSETALNEIIEYCKLEADYFTKKASRIYFSVCPQMSHFTAYTTEINGTMYIIHGPTKSKPSTGAFYHEALHHVINPLTEKFIKQVIQYEELLEVTNDKRKIGYNDWESNVNDSFCRTLSMVLNGINSKHPREEVKDWVLNEYKFGFILCMHIFEKLIDYEKDGRTFSDFYPHFFESINIEKEKKRWETN